MRQYQYQYQDQGQGQGQGPSFGSQCMVVAGLTVFLCWILVNVFLR